MSASRYFFVNSSAKIISTRVILCIIISERYLDSPGKKISCPYSPCCYKVDIREIQLKCDKTAIEMVGIWAWKFFSRWVQLKFWYYNLLLLSIKITSHHQYIPIFFVVWALVLILGKVQYSAEFSSIPLVIPQIGKNTLILAWLYSQLQSVIRGLFWRFGYRLTSIFSWENRKNKIWHFLDT